MNTRIESLKYIPRHDQLGFDPEPPGARFTALCKEPPPAARPAAEPRRAA